MVKKNKKLSLLGWVSALSLLVMGNTSFGQSGLKGDLSAPQNVTDAVGEPKMGPFPRCMPRTLDHPEGRHTCFLRDIETNEWRGGDRNYWIEQDPQGDLSFWTWDFKASFPFPKMKFSLETNAEDHTLFEGIGYFRGEDFDIMLKCDYSDNSSILTLVYAEHAESYLCEPEPSDPR